MSRETHEQLLKLSKEQLAGALVKLSVQDPSAEDTVQRLVATRKESLKRFRSKLNGLKRMTRFVDWRERKAICSKVGIDA